MDMLVAFTILAEISSGPLAFDTSMLSMLFITRTTSSAIHRGCVTQSSIEKQS